jgi:hypothetical protein
MIAHHKQDTVPKDSGNFDTINYDARCLFSVTKVFVINSWCLLARINHKFSKHILHRVEANHRRNHFFRGGCNRRKTPHREQKTPEDKFFDGKNLRRTICGEPSPLKHFPELYSHWTISRGQLWGIILKDDRWTTFPKKLV